LNGFFHVISSERWISRSPTVLEEQKVPLQGCS
jgi:hypothetical protein